MSVSRGPMTQGLQDNLMIETAKLHHADRCHHRPVKLIKILSWTKHKNFWPQKEEILNKENLFFAVGTMCWEHVTFLTPTVINVKEKQSRTCQNCKSFEVIFLKSFIILYPVMILTQGVAGKPSLFGCKHTWIIKMHLPSPPVTTGLQFIIFIVLVAWGASLWYKLPKLTMCSFENDEQRWHTACSHQEAKLLIKTSVRFLSLFTLRTCFAPVNPSMHGMLQSIVLTSRKLGLHPATRNTPDVTEIWQRTRCTY